MKVPREKFKERYTYYESNGSCDGSLQLLLDDIDDDLPVTLTHPTRGRSHGISMGASQIISDWPDQISKVLMLTLITTITALTILVTLILLVKEINNESQLNSLVN